MPSSKHKELALTLTPSSSQPESEAAPIAPRSQADRVGNAETNGHALPARAATAVCLRRLMLAVVLVAGCAELAYVVVNISAMPVYIEARGLDKSWIGIAATAFILVEGVLKSPFGVLGDRIGRKILMLGGPFLAIFTALATPHIANPYALVGLRLLDGIGAAALWPAAFSLIGDHVPEEKRASAMSLFNLAYLLGIALGPLLGGYSNKWAHHHLHLSLDASKGASFYVAAVLFAITVLVILALVPNVRGGTHDAAEHLPGSEGGFSFHDFKRMLGRMPAMLMMTFVTFLGIGLIMAYTKVYAMEPSGPFHMSELLYGKILILPALAIAAVSVPLGTLGDRIGKARAVKLGIGLCAGAYWLLLLHPNIWTLIVLGSLLGVGFVIAFPAWMALVSTVCNDKQRGAAIGAVGTAQGLGAILGVAASSILYKRPALDLGFITLPPHSLPFLGCGVMLAVAFVLAALTVHEPAPHQGSCARH